MINNKIKSIADKYSLSKDDFWLHKQSGNWIITHNAVEKIQYIEGIEMVEFKVLNSERDFARFLITMKMDDKKVTTIGEADKSNTVSKYYGMMCEKRGIDRAVLKLINAYEYGIYSDVEADDFKKKDTQATPKQQGYIYDLLMHTAFTVGSGIKIKDDFSHQFEETFKSQEKTSKFIERLKNHIKEFKNQQKEGKVV